MINLDNLTTAVGELDENKVLSMLGDFVKTNPSQEDAQKVVAACQGGMAIVGDLFEKKVYFVGDLIFAGDLLNNAIEELKPILGSASRKEVGSIVLGTVEGDLHDIGKNIFRSMAEAAGFKVVDLGIDVPGRVFVDKVKEIKPAIVGMSGVLSLALESMKAIVNALQEAGLRDGIKIIIGGNPVTKEACDQIGADAFTTNAAEGVKICQGWI
ncbi:cobalamin-binding protein [Desulfosporosinus fructosivorans]|uniref:Cobalamin-binding protein n=1 Tax=Desulfosporosinus fructosivorans TaxID=2018669 RepID=A0A4Z0QZE2_9FIRM|nr:cobalamin-dependent protein [Desulfosporosinus fructosivorans]TGE35117.1 cobalamin-binding protein [Desulfosporosinus fructosivorans]